MIQERMEVALNAGANEKQTLQWNLVLILQFIILQFIIKKQCQGDLHANWIEFIQTHYCEMKITIISWLIKIWHYNYHKFIKQYIKL